MGYCGIGDLTSVMARHGLQRLDDWTKVGSCLDMTGVFQKLVKVEDLSLCDVVDLRVSGSTMTDLVEADTPYLTYNSRTKSVGYIRARDLHVGSILMSVKPTMKYARTCYSMDMDDFVTGFGNRKSVTLNGVRYTLRPVEYHELFVGGQSKGRGLEIKNAVTVQTANGIVKTFTA